MTKQNNYTQEEVNQIHYNQWLESEKYSSGLHNEFDIMMEEYRECIEFSFAFGGNDVSFIMHKIKDFLGCEPETNHQINKINKRSKISQSKRVAVFEKDKYRCVRCKTHLNLTIDHIIPIAKDGNNDLENLQTLCKSCNSSKGTKDNSGFIQP